MEVLISTLVQTYEYNDFMLFQIVFILPLIYEKKKKKRKRKCERDGEREEKLLNAKMKWHLFCNEFCHNVWAPFSQRL